MANSRVIFQNQHYSASLMRDGSLIVQNLRRRTGKRVTGDLAAHWAKHIETAIDLNEASALCKGFLS